MYWTGKRYKSFSGYQIQSWWYVLLKIYRRYPNADVPEEDIYEKLQDIYLLGP